MQRLKEILESLPFIMQVGQSNKINKNRILETIISAAIIGGMIYGTFKTRLENMESSIIEIKQDQRIIYQNLTSRIDNLADKK